MKGSETMIKKTREETIENWINNGLSRRQAIKNAEMCHFFWSDNEIKRGELLERLIDFGIKYNKAVEMADKSVMHQIDLNTFDSDRRELREENKELRETLDEIYQPIADIFFVVLNVDEPITAHDKVFIRDAVEEISNTALTRKYFVEKLKEI